MENLQFTTVCGDTPKGHPSQQGGLDQKKDEHGGTGWDPEDAGLRASGWLAILPRLH